MNREIDTANPPPAPALVSEQDRKLIERYRVQLVPVAEIKPSPENSEVYGATNYDNDPALKSLVRSVKRLFF